jgi:hypothetical protein
MKMRTKAIAMGLSGCMVLLSACEKDVPGVGSDAKVEVFLSASHAGYGANEEALRSVEALQPETVIVPLGEDNLYLYATLLPDPVEEQDSDGLRAAIPPANGQKIRFSAFSGTTQVGIATYSYSGGQFTPVGNPLEVEPNGATYRFTAHSYYNSTATPDESNIAPSSDLVWNYKQQAVNATWNSRIVDINMLHKFSRVRVKIDAHEIANAITEIGTVQIVGGKTVNLTVRTGDVASTGTDAPQTVTLSGTSNIQTSDYYPFYPSPTSVTISSIKMTLKDLSTKTITTPLTAKFTKTLTAATSYTLVVDIREVRWAHSNVYWDETLNSGTGALTFDKTPTNPSHESYQGVLFKFGSLIGIAPIRTYDMPELTIYIPTPGTDNWDGTKQIGSAGKPWAGTDWAAVPYVTTNGSTNNYLYDMGSSVFSSYKGDICSYLTDGEWRLPNAYEFSSNSADYDVDRILVPYTEDPTGKTLMGDMGATYRSAYGVVFFPASGFYEHVTTYVTAGGHYGMYWSGTSTGSYSQAYFLFTHPTNSRFRDIFTGMNGLSVRCIKTLSTD